ncbi:MAG: glycine--tRNA ligase [Candidatus Aenigmarchaeota archaeon ex4484_52]|nr:MAG: glycine--tRNA ligase [Candidatus Aenigmarchaeota archaeon ex4484_52]
MKNTITSIQSFCKEKGFVFPNSLIYGGLSGVWDFGPLGIELKNNIKSSWWNFFVNSSENIIGMESSILSKKQIWDASGHTQNFVDAIIKCKKCKSNYRADHLINDILKIPTDNLDLNELNELIKKQNIKCQKCKGDLDKAKPFNLLFQTKIGPEQSKESIAIMRPETAQLIFTNFKLIQNTTRKKLPFGIAQIGSAYRNEISPRNFLFRCREFEQMEIEFFIDKNDEKCRLEYTKDKKEITQMLNQKILVYTADMQEKNKKEQELDFNYLIKNKIIKQEYIAYWIWQYYVWLNKIGIDLKKLRIREHTKQELSHYSVQTFDIEYNFPFGFKEIIGVADRGNYDLSQHQKFSGQKQEILNNNEKKIIPYCIEPSCGIGRIILTLLFDNLETFKDKQGQDYTIFHLKPFIAPVKIAVLPLIKKLSTKAREVYKKLLNQNICIQYDEAGSIGRRYARQDEIGTPYCRYFFNYIAGIVVYYACLFCKQQCSVF